MVDKRSWDEFRNTGLFLLVNQFLHIFGWALVVDVDESGNTIECYPARVKFRGFGAESTSKAYQKVSQYMKDNADTLLKEANE